MKARPAPIMHGLFKADPGIEEQFPSRAGHDERKRERIEIDRPKDAFASDFLIEQNRQSEAEGEAEDDIKSAKQAHIDQGGIPIRRRVGLEGPVPELFE